MWRRVGGEDFEKTRVSWRGAGWVNRWGVCADYELHPTRRPLGDYFGSTRHPNEHYLLARYTHPLTDDDHWTRYKPLEVHDLFLQFARLSKQPNSPERALAWSRRRGVLGLTGAYHHAWQGGERDTLDAFDREVVRAAGILALYEAVLNQDHGESQRLILEEYPSISVELWGSSVTNWKVEETEKTVAYEFEGNFLAYALEASSWLVERTVRQECHPTLRPEGSAVPSGLAGSWGFESLLGAMYLQMYWLMGSGGEVTRCNYCSRIISLNRPFPGARKPPKHKKFCDNACRQSYYYHNKTKSKRRAQSS